MLLNKQLLVIGVAHLPIHFGLASPVIGQFYDCPSTRHQMETFSASLTFCEENPPVTGGFPLQRLVTRNFDVFFDLRLNKPLSTQSRRRWFGTPSRSLWRPCNAIKTKTWRSVNSVHNSCDCFIFIPGIPTPKKSLYIGTGPCTLYTTSIVQWKEPL